MSTTIGVDVGGTKISAGLVDEGGTLHRVERRESPATDPRAIVTTIADLVADLSASGSARTHGGGALVDNQTGQSIAGVGVAAAGFVDKDRSTVVFAPNLAWRDEPLRALIHEQVDLPVVIENDANAAAWGEFRFGAGADAEDLLMVTVGTGIGGGVVVDGQLVRGGFGFGAEVGHLRVVPDGLLCGCGNHGCLEMYASGNALVRNARAEAGVSLLAAPLLEEAGGRPDAIDGPMITRAARRGDRFALDLLTDLGSWLGAGLASLAAVLDPTTIVIGGGVSEAGDLLLEPARKAFRSLLTARGHRPEAQIKLAELGNRSGMLGVGDLARPGR